MWLGWVTRMILAGTYMIWVAYHVFVRWRDGLERPELDDLLTNEL